jgi:hypothetical protein
VSGEGKGKCSGMDPEVILIPLFGILLSSVIVGNTHGQLAEIDFRQGEWTMGCLRRGEGKEKGHY